MQPNSSGLHRAIQIAAVGLLLITQGVGVTRAQVGSVAISSEPKPQPYYFEENGQRQERFSGDARTHSPSFTRMQSEAKGVSGNTPQRSENGGPDDYGYIWADITPQWIDATGGQDAGFVGEGNGQTKFVVLPFTFKYYEDTHNAIAIAADGFIMLEGQFVGNPYSLPSPQPPNNIIVPLQVPFNYVPQGKSGHVFYMSGGTAPGRYFVVEWYDVRGADLTIGDDDRYTFEAIIYESGDIMFNYQKLTYGANKTIWCQSVGIEDNDGLDGIGLKGNDGSSCQIIDVVPPARSILFTRPAPDAHLKASPLVQGGFVHADETQIFTVTVKNIGELGTDTFDLIPNSSWSVSLLQPDGVTKLNDTDGDQVVDTGPVDVGLTKTVIVSTTAPAQLSVLSHNTVNLQIRSSVNPARNKVANFQGAVPMAFAEIYEDSGISSSMNMLLQRPNGHTNQFLLSRGEDPVIVELSDGRYFAAWVQQRTVDAAQTVFADEIYYTILDKYGQLVSTAPRRLADVSSLVTPNAVGLYVAFGLAVDASDDGHIGLAWSQRIDQKVNGKYLYNDNAYFAVLDNSGNVVAAPTNLSNIADFAEYNTVNHQRVAKVVIAAADDNKFVTVWSQYFYGPPTATCKSYCWISNIYAAVNGSNGAVLKSATKLTDDNVGGDGIDYSNAAVTRLSGSRVAVSLDRQGDIWAMELNSNLVTVQPLLQVSTDGYTVYDDSSRIHQALNGKVVVAWESGDYPLTHIRYALLNNSLSVIAGPADMSNPNNKIGLGYLSIASDKDSNITITAMDQLYAIRQNLYYALVNGIGAQLLPPQIYRTASPYAGYSYGYIASSSNGYGTASYTAPISDTDMVLNLSAGLAAGAPGGSANIPVTIKNYGLNPTSNMVVTMTLDAGLTYLSDTTGVSPTIMVQPNRQAPQDYQTVLWTLPTLYFLETRSFQINVSVPISQAIGTRSAVQLAISSNGLDGDTSNNANAVQVMASVQTFLPMAMRQ